MQEYFSVTTDTASGTKITNDAAFDDLGRIKTVSQITADSNGNVTSQAQNGFAYNPNGQLASESQTAGVSVDYHYNGPLDSGSGQEPSALKDITLDQNGLTVGAAAYTYDNVGRVETVVMNGLTTFTYHYKDGTDLVSRIDVSFAGVTGNTLSTAYTYESNTDRLSTITATAGANTVYSAGYTYNDNDQRQTETVSQHQPDSSTSSDSHNWTFGYDSKDELTSVTTTGGGSSIYSMNYDGSGNRIDSSLGSVNSINEYAHLSYDGRGDETNNGTLAFTWDAQGHLIAVTPDSPVTGSTKETNFYDGQNRLIEEDTSTYTATAWDTPTIQKFVYNGTQLVEILDGENNDVEDFTWGPGGQLLGIQRGSTAYAVVTDGTTNAVELVNAATGAIVAEEQIAPFGQPIISTGSAADFTMFNMAGMRYDKSSGLYYAINRWYDPATGQFLKTDPADVQGGYNLRTYCNNDPINSIDPSGLDPYRLQLTAVGDANQEDAFYQRLNAALTHEAQWDKALTHDVLVRLKATLPATGLPIAKLLYDPKIRTALNFAIRASLDKWDFDTEYNWINSHRVDDHYIYDLDKLGYLYPRDIDEFLNYSDNKEYTRFDRFMMLGGGSSGTNLVRGMAFGSMFGPAAKAGPALERPPATPDLGSNAPLEWDLGGFDFNGPATEIATEAAAPLRTAPVAGASGRQLLLFPDPSPNQAIISLPPYDGVTTHSLFLANEGPVLYFESGDALYPTYIATGHAEGKAALWIRNNGSSGGVLWHNNTNGTCGFCDAQLEALLPEGATLRVIPPGNAVANNSRAVDYPSTYIGNSKTPKLRIGDER